MVGVAASPEIARDEASLMREQVFAYHESLMPHVTLLVRGGQAHARAMMNYHTPLTSEGGQGGYGTVYDPSAIVTGTARYMPINKPSQQRGLIHRCLPAMLTRITGKATVGTQNSWGHGQ